MTKLSILATLALVLGCSVSDKDRCSEGRHWSDEYGGCLPPTTGGATSTTTTNSNGGTAEGGTSGASSTPESSLGTVCTEQDDPICADGGATVCLLDPSDPTSPGVCTIPNCDSASCGESFDCCDCSGSTTLKAAYTVPLCVPMNKVSIVKGLGCTCS